MSEDSLKPCPFCGGDDLTVQSGEYVNCRGCGADGPYFASADDHTDDAIAAWNTRHEGSTHD